MMTAAMPQLELSALAHVLFASPVQPSELPSPSAIRTAIEVQLGACHGNMADCLAVVAQEAGDHPNLYAARMRWARRSVDAAYLGRAAEDGGPLALSGPLTGAAGSPRAIAGRDYSMTRRPAGKQYPAGLALTAGRLA
jgi:hypothetical protein